MEPEDPRPSLEIAPACSQSGFEAFPIVGRWDRCDSGNGFPPSDTQRGQSGLYQPTVDSLFHNWIVTASAAVLVWLARREVFGPLRSRFLRGLSGLVALW